MEYKKAIYKKREVDLTATMASLNLNEAVFLPFSAEQRIEAIRTAASRLGKAAGVRYSVTNTINGTVIRRTE